LLFDLNRAILQSRKISAPIALAAFFLI